MIDGCGEDEKDEDENVLHFLSFFKLLVCVGDEKKLESQTDDSASSLVVSLSRF